MTAHVTTAPRPPGLLASVATLAEMDLALAGGADIVDLKDPAAGALGAWAPGMLGAAVERWRAAGAPLAHLPVSRHSVSRHRADAPDPRIDALSRAPVSASRESAPGLSATVGDHPLDAGRLRAAAERTAAAGVPLVKIGFALPRADAALALAPVLAALAPLARRARLVGVLFADQGPDLAVVPGFAAAGFHGVMLDTADKAAGGLLAHMDMERLAAFVAAARGRGLLTGLAGSLRVEDIAPLAALGPHYLGFRGALCAAGRAGALDPARLAAVRDALRGRVAA